MQPGIEAVLVEALGSYEVPSKRSALESQLTLFYFLTHSFYINEQIRPVIIFDMWFQGCCTQIWTKPGERKWLSGSNPGTELSSDTPVQNGPGQTLELDIQALAQQKIQIFILSWLQIGVGEGKLQTLALLQRMCNLGRSPKLGHLYPSVSLCLQMCWIFKASCAWVPCPVQNLLLSAS